MQGVMLLLEIVVVMLLLAEVFIRLRARRRRLQNKSSVSDKSSAPVSSAARLAPDADAPQIRSELLSVEAVASSVTTTGGAEQQVLSINDLLDEAVIYMEYGHYAQAATVLRWYVDLNPHETKAINRLLDAYLAMADIDSYAELLEALGEKPGAAPMNEAWWKERVDTGLAQDPGNLELLVLAEKVGMVVPLPQAQAQASETAMTAEMALALVSRNADPAYGMAVLQRAIAHEPQRLPLYAELLRITHQQRRIEDYLNTLILLFLAVRVGGKTLRERMLRAGVDLGPHPLWSVLAQWNGDPEILRRLAQSRHLEIPAGLSGAATDR
jgi:tetratricopeptide (TPR) repeat protein